MPLALNFYHDQIDAEGAASAALPAAPRMLYVRHGTVEINGQAMKPDDSCFCDGAVAIKSTGEWAQIWRWDLAPPNAAPMLHEGAGILSSLRMARVISTLALLPGTNWLFRLDQITSAAGRIADRHQHPGPGIRCLKEGAFNVQQDAESARDLAPGDAWWETGSDTVIAWSSRTMAARFMRGMVLPPEWEGKVTGSWLSGEAHVAPRGNWKLYVDKIVGV